MCEKCAVILAGGLGTRLRPYTISLPKPLVPIGNYPILEIVIRQLSSSGFSRVIIAVNHQADIIQAYFGDGSKWGINIEYSLEKKQLGTMGPLKMIENLPDNFLVMNGDVLTNLDFSRFLEDHSDNNRLFSISSYCRVQKIDYGVLHTDEVGFLTEFEEKPNLPYVVSMGVYAVSKRILSFIPYDTFYGFDNLMKDMLGRNEKINVVMFDGYWLDIGRPSDYEKAILDFESNQGGFFNENISNRP